MFDWLATLYAWQKKVRRQQQAWRWWYQQNALQSHSIAETIRDGPLQEAFALRRSLEIAGWSVNEAALKSPNAQVLAEQTTRWREAFQTLYQNLVSLSDQLSPPFIADSLPLALQFTLQNFTLQNKSFADLLVPNSSSDRLAANLEAKANINFDFKVIPNSWPTAYSHQNQAILSTVTSLLRLLLPTSDLSQPIVLTLNHRNAINVLTLHLQPRTDCPSVQVAKLYEIQHLKEIFHSLVAGQIIVSQTANSTICHLYWQNEENYCLP